MSVQWEVIDATDDEETKQVLNDGSLTSLYEVIKIAYLEPDEKTTLETLPKIQSSVSYGFASISIDASVFIFGEGCSSFQLNLMLECTINVMVWLPGGKFLLLADNSGTLHCLHVDSKRIVFTKKIPIIGANRTSLFIEGKSFNLADGTSSVIFITSGGKIIRLDAIESELLEEGLKTKDFPFLKSLQEKMSLSIYSVIEDDAEILCADCLVFGSSNLCVWLATKSGIYTWMSEWIYTSQPISYKLSTVSSCTALTQLMNGRYLVVLDESKGLRVLCGHSGIIIWDSVDDNKLDGSVLSVQSLFTDNSSAQLLLLLQKHEGSDSSFCIFNIPSLECSHMVTVDETALPCILGDGADSIIYLEPEFTSKDVDSSLSRIKLKSVVDSVPEARLTKLLKKLKFNDAEEFCSLYGLEVNEVLKAKAKYLCDLMNPWRSISANSTIADHDSTTGHFDELLLTLGRITDNEFVTTLCINAALSDVGATRKLLSYAKERLAKSSQSGDSDHLSSLMRKVSKTLYSLCTFKSIFPLGDIQHWLSFSHADMLEEFLDHLEKGDLEIAATIWHRHHFEFVSRVNEECVSQILCSIPFSVASEKLCSWLPKHILKDLIKLFPTAIEMIAKWTDERIKTLEIFEKDHWPSNGLKLATTTIGAIETVAADFYTEGDVEVQLAIHMAQWMAHSPSSSLCRLRQTALALTDLDLLAREFFIKVEFCKYTQEDKVAVSAALLDWLVSGDEVEPLVRGFLNAFLFRHNLQLDQVLEQYVIDCLAVSDYDWWLYKEAPWEDKLYAVIGVIADAQVKAKCIVECVRMAPVPWSKGTREMCSLGMSLNTPFTKDLQEQERLSRLKIVLRRHNLHFIKYADGRNREFILRSIVSHDGESIMEDALTVVSAFISISTVDAYYYRILHLMKMENNVEIKHLLSALEEDKRRNLYQRLISYVTQQVNIRPLNQKCRENLRSLTAGVLALQLIFEKNLKLRFTQYENVLDKIRRINALQGKYDLYPSLDDLDNEECCLNLLKEFIVDLHRQSKATSSKPAPNLTSTRVSVPVAPLKGASHGVSSIFVPTGKEHRTLNFTNNLLVDEEEDQENYLDKHMNKVEFMASLLGISRSRLLTLLASLANQHGQIDLALQFTRQLANRVESASVTQLIFKVVEMTVVHCQNESIVANVCQQKGDFMSLVGSIVSPAILVCHPRDITILNDFAFWYHIGKYLYKQCHLKGISANNDPVSNDFWHWKLSPVFIDKSMPIEEPIVSRGLSKIISDALQIHKGNDDPRVTEKMVELNGNKGSVSEAGTSSSSVEQLCRHLRERSQDLFAFLISQNVRAGIGASPDLATSEWFKALTPEHVFTLLMKIINSKQQDLSFACSLLTHLTVKEALKVLTDIIKKLGYDFSRLLLVGEIGNDFCSIKQLTKISSQFSVLVKKASWGKLLEKFGISFKAGFSDDKNALFSILKELTSHKDCTFAILKDFCQDFSLDMTQALSCYLRATIRMWKPHTKTDNAVPDTGDSFHEISSSYVRKIKAIICKMEKKSEARHILEEEFTATSSYNYEMLDVIMSMLSSFEDDGDEGAVDIKRGKNLLRFLILYRRRSEPDELENDAWQSKDPEIRSLPLVARSRLPFHELHHKDKDLAVKLVGRELNRNTVDKWVTIANTLKINTDQLYFLATQNIVSEALEKQDNPQGWQIHSTNGNLLSHIEYIISCIKHRNLATACANWVVGRFPPGEDKVLAAKSCFFIASSCLEQEQDPDSQTKLVQLFEKFETRYYRLAIEHALHKYGLAEPQYLSLIRDPGTLVFRLYEHPSLSSLATLNARHMIDINGCVTQICNIMNFSQTSIQLEILSKWLPMTACSSDDQDDTVSNFVLRLDQDAPADDKRDIDSDDSLSRIIFLLRCLPQDQAVSYLLNQALSENETVGTAVRLKALRCLLAVANEETIQKQSDVSLEEIGRLLQTLKYVYQLEELGHTTTPSGFASMDKDALVEGIWRAQRHNPDALLLLVDICQDFKIPTASLWEALLAQLTNFTKAGKVDVKALEKVLMRIRNIPHLWLLPQVTAAWTHVIYSPFKKASAPVTEENLTECVHAMNLLLRSCPVDIPLERLLDLCISLDLPILALTLQYKMQINECKIEDLLRQHSSSKLNSQYERVKEHIAFPQNIEDLLSTMK